MIAKSLKGALVGAVLLGAPAVLAQPQPERGEAVQGLVDALLERIDQAERNRSADPRFLADLRELAQRYTWSWQNPVLRDSFEDGDYTRNPAWEVAAGDFWVDAQLGLRSRVEGAAGSAGTQPQRPADPAARIFGTVLEELARGGAGGHAGEPAARGDLAEIHTRSNFANAFSVALRLTAVQPGGVVEFGPFQGEQRNVGYRLVYADQQGSPAIELHRLTSRGSSIVQVADDGVPALSGGGFREVVWTRDAEGAMSVAVDGRTVLEAADRGLRDGFAGVTIVNRGGDFAIREIAVDEAAGQAAAR